MDVIERIGVEPVATHVGAVITGLDLTRPLSAETVAFLRRTLAERGVLFFRGQSLSNEQ